MIELQVPQLLQRLCEQAFDQQLATLQEQSAPAACLEQLGDEAEALALRDLPRALQATEMLVQLSDALGHGQAQARTRRARAQALAYAGEHEAALHTCRDARDRALRADARVEAARALAIMMHPLGELGLYDEGVAAGEQARKELMELGQPKLAGRADFNLGVVHQNRDDPAQALFHFDRAAPCFADDPLITGYLQSNRGEALLLLHDFTGSEAAFRAASEACRTGEAHVAYAIAEGNLGDLYARLGRLSESLHHFETARRLLAQHGAASHLARLLSEQAEAERSLGVYASAEATLRETIPQLQEHGLTWELARASLGLADVLLQRAAYEEATPLLAEAAKRFTELGHPLAAARTALRQVVIAREHGALETAEAVLGNITKTLHERPLDRIALRTAQASLHEAGERFDQADGEWTLALAEAEEMNLAPLAAELVGQRGLLRSRTSRLEEAANDLARAVAATESQRSTLQSQRLRADYMQQRYPLYETYVDVRLTQADADTLPDVFRTIEAAKSRTLLDTIGHSSRIDGNDPDLQSRWETVSEELVALYSEARSTNTRHTFQQADWQAAVATRVREQEDLERRIAAGLNSRQDVNPIATLPVMQANLPADASLVQFFVKEDETLAIVLGAGDAHLIRIPLTRVAARELVRSVRFSILRALRPGAGPKAMQQMLAHSRRSLTDAYQRIWAPLAEHIPAERKLVIAPHDALHLLPFHAMLDGPQYLLERHTISYVPSGSVLRRALALEAAGTEAVVLAAEDRNAPQILTEAERLADVLNTRCRLGADANVENAVEAMQQARLLHIACHGRFQRDLPLASGILLNDRWLTVSEITQLSLRAELVTLSACDTARHGLQAGDELIGLVASLLTAGAQRVLVSQWPAHDAATAQLMPDFYRIHLDRPGEMSFAEALRAAQRTLMQSQPHPLFWAPFVMVGKP